ncbi:hypothetical protein KCU92_g3106, partial [Aureobasidium melanogenum]
MKLFDRTSSSGSLKSDKSAANTKNNVGFSDQPPNESLENKEPAANSEPCNDPEAEKKSSASVEMPELKPSKCLYDKKSAYYVIREVCDHETHQMIELERRLQDKLADYTFSTNFLRFGNLHSSNTLSYPLPGLSLLRCYKRIMHENLRPANSALYTTFKSIQDAKARLDLRDPFETTSISSAGGGSHVIPETPPSSDTAAVSSIVEQENVLEGDRWVAPSRSLADAMHKKLLSGALAASNKALASIERDCNPSYSRMEPLKLDSSSTEARSQTSERITSQRRNARSSTGIGVAPPPRFNNPAKITKSKDEERGTASYLN